MHSSWTSVTTSRLNWDGTLQDLISSCMLLLMLWLLFRIWIVSWCLCNTQKSWADSKPHILVSLLSFKELASSSSSADRQNPREWCKIFQALSCTLPLLWTPRRPSLGFLVCLQYQLLWSSCTMLWLPCYASPGSFVSLQYVLEVSRNKRRWSVTKCRQVNSRNKLTPNPCFVNILCRALHCHWQKFI